MPAPNPLFGPGPRPNLNACVGRNGGPYDFSAYAQGFFASAFYNIENVAEGKWTIDLLIYPICFSLRHGIELYLKHLVIVGSRLTEQSQFRATHKLTDNWLRWKQIAAQLPNGPVEQDQLNFAENAIEHFAAIDPNGEAFRYPEDLARNISLLGISVINLATLYDEMKRLSGIFEAWDCNVGTLLENRGYSWWSVEG